MKFSSEAAATWVSPAHTLLYNGTLLYGLLYSRRDGKGSSENLAVACEPVGPLSLQLVGRYVMSHKY